MAGTDEDAQLGPAAGRNGNEKATPNANAIPAATINDDAENAVSLTKRVGSFEEWRRWLEPRQSREVPVPLHSGTELSSGCLLAEAGRRQARTNLVILEEHDGDFRDITVA